MSKIRRLEDLQSLIDGDLAWRKRELSIMKSLVRSSVSSPYKRDCLIRTGVTLAYAHWEGYVKVVGTAYVRFVATLGLPYQQLALHFVALGMKKRLGHAKVTNRAAEFNEISRFFLFGQEQKCDLSPDSAIDTRSNLTSQVLEEIACALGLDYSLYSTKSKLIDEKLLASRNQIAHGRLLLVDIGEYLELHDAVVDLMQTFGDQVSNAASSQTYLRPAP